ncbi:hypothetical protein tb265_13510 [Gemmatimonadetes bacterium T265]|nr:hypothetical protein tb265_13510 [Gemmatimonadetes bacterium T265]
MLRRSRRPPPRPFVPSSPVIVSAPTSHTPAASRAPATAWVLDALDEALFLVDAAGRVTWCSARAEEMLAAPRDELAGRPVREAVPGLPTLDAPPARPVTWRALRLTRHDGTALWADVTAAARRPLVAAAVDGPGLAHARAQAAGGHNGGPPGGAFGGYASDYVTAYAVADVTPRVTAEAARRRAEERFGTLVEQAVEGIYVVQDDRFVYVNAQLAALTGYTVEELLALPSVGVLLARGAYARAAATLAPEQARQRKRERAADRRRSDALLLWSAGRLPPFAMRRKDGSRAEVELRGRVAEYGGRPAAIGTAVDVTERRRTEAALRRQALIVDALHDAVVVLGPDLRVVDWNRGAERLFGYARAAAVGREAGFVHPPPDAAADGSVLGAAAPGGAAAPTPTEARLAAVARDGRWTGELPFVTRQGAEGVADVTLVANRAPDGTLLGYIEVSRDVTARRRAEAALAAREVELRQAQKMEAVGRLAGGIAHDFNNLLAAISSYAELLLDAFPADPAAAPPGALAAVVADAREDVREIRRAAERGATLTRQLLAFGRGQLLQAREIDLNAVVGGLGRLLGRVLGAEVELRLALAPEAAPVLADPGQLEQVLLNLAVNARDAMPGGGVLSIGTRHVAVAEGAAGDLTPGCYVAVDVRDTGVGMDAATRARIFEPFFTTKPAGQGTGLGLAMVYGIVAQTGGRVTVDSAPGRGTTFSIYLPALAPPAPAAAPPARGADPAPERPGAAPAPDGAGTTVLVVDDEAAVRGAAARVLARRGYTVLEAGDGVEALGVAERYAGPVHLLLSDVRMPGMDGRELARRFRVARPEARVLLMTGYPGSEGEEHAALATPVDRPVNRSADGPFDLTGELGDAPALQKPFTLDALAERVREVTARAER